MILDKNSTKNEYKPKCTKINKMTREKKLLINLPGTYGGWPVV